MTDLVTAMSEAVITHGSAQCVYVPGDQADRLRQRLKEALRGRSGHLRTFHTEDMVFIHDEDHPGHPDDRKHLMETLHRMFTGEPPEPEWNRRSQPWFFDWDDWSDYK